MEITSFIRDATQDPMLGRLVAVTGNEAKCLPFATFSEEADEMLSCGEITDMIDLMRNGMPRSGFDQTYWSAVCIQHVKSGVFVRSEGPGVTNANLHSYGFTAWGKDDVRPFSGYATSLSLRTEGIRQLLGEPRIPQEKEQVRLFGKLGLLMYATDGPVSDQDARDILHESGVFTGHQAAKIVDNFNKHPFTEMTDEGTALIPNVGRIIQGYHDILVNYLTIDRSLFRSIGAQLLEASTSEPSDIKKLEEHSKRKTAKTQSNRVHDYGPMTNTLVEALATGSILTSALDALFPSLTVEQVQRFRNKLNKGEIDGVLAIGKGANRSFILNQSSAS